VEDCYILADYHKIINYYLPDKKSCQLKCSQGTSLISWLLCLFVPQALLEVCWLWVDLPAEFISANTQNSASTLPEDQKHIVVAIRALEDVNGVVHHQVQYEKTRSSKGKLHTKSRMCKLCDNNESAWRLMGFYCSTCNIPLCCPTRFVPQRDCFKQHVEGVWRVTRTTSSSWQWSFFVVAGDKCVHLDQTTIFPSHIVVG